MYLHPYVLLILVNNLSALALFAFRKLQQWYPVDKTSGLVH